MDEILKLERKLKLNKISILRVESDISLGLEEQGIQKRHRELLLQRSAIKDMLLEQYRQETLERRKDHEYISSSKD